MSATTSTQASYKILDIVDFNPKDIVLGKWRKNSNGQGASVPIFIKDGNQNKQIYLRIKSPMRAPFGAGTPPPQYVRDESNIPWSLALEFGSSEDDQKALKTMQAIDQRMIEEATKAENSYKWLGSPKNRPYSQEVVQTMYTPIVKISVDKQTGEPSSFPPQMRLKLPTTFRRDDEPRKFLCSFFDASKQPMNISPDINDPNNAGVLVPSNSRCSVIIRLDKIWIAARRFGITLKAQQVLVLPPVSFPTNTCLFDDVTVDTNVLKSNQSSTPMSFAESSSTEPQDIQVEFEEEDPEYMESGASKLSVMPVLRS